MWWTVQGSNRAALTTLVGRVSNQPSGLLLSPRFPTRRNVYQERCRPFGLGIFCGGRYRARTATTTTAACGRNREELLGQRSDFSRPRQGAEEKSANATRKAAHSAVSKATVRLCLARGSQRLGMSTKKDADHSVWGFFCGERHRAAKAASSRQSQPMHPQAF